MVFLLLKITLRMSLRVPWAPSLSPSGWGGAFPLLSAGDRGDLGMSRSAYGILSTLGSGTGMRPNLSGAETTGRRTDVEAGVREPAGRCTPLPTKA